MVLTERGSGAGPGGVPVLHPGGDPQSGGAVHGGAGGGHQQPGRRHPRQAAGRHAVRHPLRVPVDQTERKAAPVQ